MINIAQFAKIIMVVANAPFSARRHRAPAFVGSSPSYFPAQNWCFGKSGQGRAATQDPPGATGGGFTEPDGEGGRIYRAARFSIARPMLMRLSAMTPRPTQRFIPASPL